MNKILIVDDDISIGKTMGGILRKEGYDVKTLNDGYKAIDDVKENSYDIVLLDIKMPGINGVETFKEIKKISPETVVIMMTAYAVDELRQEAIKEGAYDILDKPLEMEGVLDCIEKIGKMPVILVVDDDFGIRDSLSLNLENMGYRVINAEDGEKAVERFSRKPADVILMDIRMPKMDGVETLKKIREMVKKDEMPVTIMMSGYEAKKEVEKAYSYGAKAFFTKPFDFDRLKRTIEKLLNKEEASILIVDDDPEVRSILSDILKDAGYNVESVSDGNQAIQKVKDDHCEVIVMDVRLPDIDGFKIYEKIKKIKPDANIIMMTGYTQDKAIIKTIQEGGLPYLVKPFEPSKLLEIIKKIITVKNE